VVQYGVSIIIIVDESCWVDEGKVDGGSARKKKKEKEKEKRALSVLL
jgi:hypothetical protein